jgi:D-amino peptidase
MKVFISADMEGLTGTTSWEEVDIKSPFYAAFAEQMTKEVIAACEGAFLAGATEIVVKDAHSTATNIDISKLPENVKLIRSWSGHPYCMVDGIDNSFDAAMFIGYHSGAGGSGNPLSHTMTFQPLYVKINNIHASEFMIYSYAAAYEGIPTVFLSGDKRLCEESQLLHPKLMTTAVKDGKGGATINYSPEAILKQIKKTAENALKQDLTNAKTSLPDSFEVEIAYKEHKVATRKSYYPGMEQINSNTLIFKSNNYFEVLRMLGFVL